jgi:hypothetical protein
MSKSKIPTLAATDDIQDPSRHWKSTISFRRFRKKHNELSKINWTSMLGSHLISQKNAEIGAGEKLTYSLASLPFKPHALPATKEDLVAWLPEYESLIRSHVLLACSGNLELYLKRSIRFYLAANGYASSKDRFSLTSVGQATGRPVLQASTIHVQLRYVQDLLGMEFKNHLLVWEKAYKERCNFAHQAGVVTHLDKEDIQFYGANLVTDWPALLQLLDSTNQICGVIDQKVSSAKARLLELEFELSMLKAAKKLPKKDKLWHFVHSELGSDMPTKAEKLRIESELY